VNNSPTLVAWQGEYVEAGMREARLTTIEIDAAIRKAGIQRMDDVAAVIVEPDSSLSALARDGRALGASLFEGLTPHDADHRK
jgi:uncharacterized membrane protein YcaP (DUF421 family)